MASPDHNVTMNSSSLIHGSNQLYNCQIINLFKCAFILKVRPCPRPHVRLPRPNEARVQLDKQYRPKTIGNMWYWKESNRYHFLSWCRCWFVSLGTLKVKFGFCASQPCAAIINKHVSNAKLTCKLNDHLWTLIIDYVHWLVNKKSPSCLLVVLHTFPRLCGFF